MEGGDAAAEMGWKAGTPWGQEKSENAPATTTGSPFQNSDASTAARTASAGKRTAASRAQDSKPFSGDRTLAQSILFMNDAMLSRDASQAVAMGDVGRLWNDLKVRYGGVVGWQS